MTTIIEQLNQPYVGNIVYLYHFDLTPLGSNLHFYFTPHSGTPISYNGQVYNPLPIEMTGISSNMDAAPGRATISIGAGTEGAINRLLLASIISLGDLVGARVNLIKTFENFLDGKPDGGSDQSFPTLRFIINKKNRYSSEGISWTLTTELDRPHVFLPLRQCLKSDVGRGALFAPGMQRLRL